MTPQAAHPEAAPGRWWPLSGSPHAFAMISCCDSDQSSDRLTGGLARDCKWHRAKELVHECVMGTDIGKEGEK